MSDSQEPRPELVEEFRREVRGLRNAMLRSGVVHGYDDLLFETIYGPLDDEDRATIVTWRKRLDAKPMLTVKT